MGCPSFHASSVSCEHVYLLLAVNSMTPRINYQVEWLGLFMCPHVDVLATPRDLYVLYVETKKTK